MTTAITATACPYPTHDSLKAYRRGCRCPEAKAKMSASRAQYNADRRVGKYPPPIRAVKVETPPTPAATRWQDRAACADTDPESFFPLKGESSEPAERVCRGCEVAAECLQFALSVPERDGVWGATTPEEREAIRRRKVQAAAVEALRSHHGPIGADHLGHPLAPMPALHRAALDRVEWPTVKEMEHA